jgi:hypothetical protein
MRYESTVKIPKVDYTFLCIFSPNNPILSRGGLFFVQVSIGKNTDYLRKINIMVKISEYK